MIIPTKEECLRILKEQNVPDNIIAHSKAVCDFAMKICDLLEKRGINVNRDLVTAGSLLHDVKKINAEDHVFGGFEYIKSLGFTEVALIIKRHGLQHVNDDEFIPQTWEEKIVFYADKRVKDNKVVSVDERFEHIKKRYNRDDVEKEYNFAKKMERELFGDENCN